MSRLDAVIVFEPTGPMVESACRQLASLGGNAVLLDNSESVDAQRLVSRTCEHFSVQLLRPGGNVGTGRGINLLLREAADRGVTWLHYLDQDSQLTGAYRSQLARLPPRAEDFALIGAVHVDPGQPLGSVSSSRLEPARFVISSGTLFNVAAVTRADGADERLFLDLVDHELCLRVRSQGMKVAIDHARVLRHPIGEGAQRVGQRLTLWRHPEWRRELMWRNSCLLVREYRTVAPMECLRHMTGRVIETLASVLAFRDLRYLRSAVRGTRAARLVKGNRCGYSCHTKRDA